MSKFEYIFKRILSEDMTGASALGGSEGLEGGSVGNEDTYAPGDMRTPKSIFGGVLTRSGSTKKKNKKKKKLKEEDEESEAKTIKVDHTAVMDKDGAGYVLVKDRKCVACGTKEEMLKLHGKTPKSRVWVSTAKVGQIVENFADGKKKGKSRPGRVKRSGASCKGTVTELRKRAKKYGGEKGKMYQWCANMKSGKKKSESEEEQD